MLSIGLIIVWVTLTHCGFQTLPVCPTLLPQNTCQACEEASETLESLKWHEMGFCAWERHAAPLSANTIILAKRCLCTGRKQHTNISPLYHDFQVYKISLKHKLSLQFIMSIKMLCSSCSLHSMMSPWKTVIIFGEIIIRRSTYIGSGWDGVSIPHSILHSTVLCSWKLLITHQCFGCCWAVLPQHRGCLSNPTKSQ